MSATRLFLAGLVMAATLLAGRADAAFESGIWSGDAFLGPDGQFQRCAIVGDYEGSTDLSFGLNPDGVYEVYLIDKSWTLQPGQVAQITIKVDDRAEITGGFQVIGRDTLATLLERRPELVQAFKAGNVATFTGFFGTLTFPLTGTAKAFAAMENCVREVLAGIDEGRQAASTARLAQIRGAAIFELQPDAFAYRVLMELPTEEFVIPSDMAEAAQRWRAALVWRIRQGVGLIRAVNGQPSEEDLRAGFENMKRATCAGTLTSEADLRLLPGGDAVLRHVELSCSDTGNGQPAFEVMTFFPHATPNLIAISHIGETLEAARAADLAFMQQIGAIAARP